MQRLLAALFSLCVAACAAAAPTAPPRLKAGVFEPPRPAPELALRGSDGAELRLARFRGQVVLMTFGFTHCAAVCPVTLATLAQARQALGSAAAAVQVVFVTVDPQRDDAARMKSYLAAFDPSFLGATGSPEAMAVVRRSYGVVAEKHATADGYVMDHSSSIFLIDRQGKLRAAMPYGHDAKDFAHDVALLLAQ